MDSLTLLKKFRNDGFSFSFSDEILSHLCFHDFRIKQLQMFAFENYPNTLLNDDGLQKFPQRFHLIQELELSLERLEFLKQKDLEMYTMVEQYYKKDIQYQGFKPFQESQMESLDRIPGIHKRDLRISFRDLDLSSDSIQEIPFKSLKKVKKPFYKSFPSKISPEDSMKITRQLVYQHHLKLKWFFLRQENEFIQIFDLKDLQAENDPDFYKVENILEIIHLESEVLKMRCRKLKEFLIFLEHLFPMEYKAIQLECQKTMKYFHVLDKFVERV